MKPIPAKAAAAHGRFMEALCEDFRNADWDTPRAKAVIEINRQTRQAERD